MTRPCMRLWKILPLLLMNPKSSVVTASCRPISSNHFLNMARSTAGTIPHEHVARDEEGWLYGSAAAFGGTAARAGITKEEAAAFIDATNGKPRKKRRKVPKSTND